MGNKIKIATPKQQARLDAYLLTSKDEKDLDEKYIQTKTTFGVDRFINIKLYEKLLIQFRNNPKSKKSKK